ncbi:hypothetical protein Lepto7375DRAFT_6709 [Leptolyngbya sp. PCC 7375]|nr:hypothetical protein Lepto7375DRAFT_6709 [Leptolyngbya sp. PCC 7375]
MSDCHINIGPIECQLLNLIASTVNSKSGFADTRLQCHQPFSLGVTVEFSGPGAIALMSLSPTIQVEFYAKPLSPEPSKALGSIVVQALPDVLVYTPTLMLSAPQSIGLSAKVIYRIGAVLRVGAPEGPSIVHGFTEALTIEIYKPKKSK